MNADVSRSLGYYARSHWFQWAVLFVVVGAFAIGLLSALDDAKARTEKVLVELTLRNIRTGMLYAMGEALMRHRESEMAAWVGSNPVRWLDSPPEGYRGECQDEAAGHLSGGEWCFERGHRQLVYRPRSVDYLRLFPALAGDADIACSQLRWHVVRLPEGVVTGGSVRPRIEAASRCQWFFGRDH